MLTEEQLNRLVDCTHSPTNRSKETPDLIELVQGLSVLLRFNPASGARLVFEVIEALAADPKAKINNIVVTLGEGDKQKTFMLNKQAESNGCEVWNLG